MKKSLLPNAIQNLKSVIKLKGIFTFLIIFFMTISSYGQSAGITFNCDGGIVTFGAPDGTDGNNLPYWINGSDGTNTYTLYVEDDNGADTWALRQLGSGPDFPDENYIPGPRFFYLAVSAGSICTDNWTYDLLSCTSLTVTCNQTNDPDNDGDGFNASVDCDDNNSAVNPGATEICDGIDNDCDGQTDEDGDTTYYVDNDQDTYGDIADTIGALYCNNPGVGFSLTNNDCNDANDTIYPLAVEICDGVDNNCDGTIDEGQSNAIYYADVDGDGFGDLSNSVSTCDGAPIGFVEDNTDCFDDGIGAETAYPGATEVPGDLIDNDCDGVIDEDDDQTDMFEFCNTAKTKVLICHNGKDKCVSINAVDAHLGHGDSLGSCTSTRSATQEDSNFDNQDITEVNPRTIDVVSWPNPSINFFNVKMITPNFEDKVDLQVFDINGRLIHSNVINGNEDYQFGNNLSNGVYFVKISQTDNSKVMKVIKH